MIPPENKLSLTQKASAVGQPLAGLHAGRVIPGQGQALQEIDQGEQGQAQDGGYDNRREDHRDRVRIGRGLHIDSQALVRAHKLTDDRAGDAVGGGDA